MIFLDMTQKSQGVYQTKNLYNKGNNQNEEPAYKMGKYICKPCMWYGISIQKLIQSMSSKFNYACKELVFKELVQLNCKKKKKYRYKNGQKTRRDIFSKTHKWLRGVWKGIQYH